MPTNLTRSVLAVLIPGLVAIAPWLLALLQYTSATLGLDRFPVVAYALVFASVAVVGSIFEGIATFIEVRWDSQREAEHSVKENWYRYLSRTFEKEPVGYRYLSRLATALYFELAMVIAVPIFVAGAGLLAALRFPNYAPGIVVAAVVAVVVLGVYFWWQASCTHRVLCMTRKELNARIERQPADGDTASRAPRVAAA